MSRAAEIQSILDEFIPRLDALRDAAMKEIAAAQEVAQANVSRHGEAQEELARVEAQIGRLEAERESLPVQVSRANLDEDFELEDDLRERYRDIKARVEGLEQRKESLREEIHALNPTGDSHPNNVTIGQYAEVASVAAGPRAELERLQDQLGKALAGAVDPVIAKHESLKGTTWQLSHDRAWAESPITRGGIPG